MLNSKYLQSLNSSQCISLQKVTTQCLNVFACARHKADLDYIKKNVIKKYI